MSKFKSTRKERKLGYKIEPAMKSKTKIPKAAIKGKLLNLILVFNKGLTAFLRPTKVATEAPNALRRKQDDKDDD